MSNRRHQFGSRLPRLQGASARRRVFRALQPTSTESLLNQNQEEVNGGIAKKTKRCKFELPHLLRSIHDIRIDRSIQDSRHHLQIFINRDPIRKSRKEGATERDGTRRWSVRGRGAPRRAHWPRRCGEPKGGHRWWSVRQYKGRQWGMTPRRPSRHLELRRRSRGSGLRRRSSVPVPSRTLIPPEEDNGDTVASRRRTGDERDRRMEERRRGILVQ